jgi:hypothetical protein
MRIGRPVAHVALLASVVAGILAGLRVWAILGG